MSSDLPGIFLVPEFLLSEVFRTLQADFLSPHFQAVDLESHY